ncbi:uncharacterized protein TEOVI_000224800 [Trypanosoma equiperdum]|uniref:Uncharacterized protein n=2 Tax=Trypanozoon TaxID=39700 RepID=Q57ZB3_TRYB2|nr:hypothetical protein, conserved [Trypanosoma brucei brucei TREU927]AAX80225.1 hypothetical protein, conserved [Trypanosoma brucei]AAZ10233.1 hypothetical protein, conserved [Trypanosoma brucei brucei TREU927]SCU70674.1 hypothetical protein, conserved [Trypanosoma equiperdum]
MSTGAELLSKALQLQHTRCETYRLWDAKFHCALGGALSASDFETAVNNSIIAAFRCVSLSFRELQCLCRDSTDDACRFLCVWIDELQELEQRHYNISVQFAQLVVQHCTALPLHSSTSQTDMCQTAANEEAENSGVENGSKEVQGTADVSENEKSTVANGERNNSSEVICASLHDRQLCELQRIIPLQAQSVLNYVTCRDDFFPSSSDDECEGDQTGGDGCTSNGADSEPGDLLVPFHHKSGVVATYSPGEVKKRCATFNAAVMPLWRSKLRLRQQLQEKMDELQEEITSASSVFP